MFILIYVNLKSLYLFPSSDYGRETWLSVSQEHSFWVIKASFLVIKTGVLVYENWKRFIGTVGCFGIRLEKIVVFRLSVTNFFGKCVYVLRLYAFI